LALKDTLVNASRAGRPEHSRKEVEKRKLRDRIVNTLGQRIVAGEIGEGALIGTEQQLCDELGASRTVVREAVKVLMAKGMVKSLPGTGTFVQGSDAWRLFDAQVIEWHFADAKRARQMMHNISEMRESFEPQAAFLAAARRTEEQLATMRKAIDGMFSFINYPEDQIALDLEFHKSILDATGNNLYRAFGDLLSAALMKMFRLGLTLTPSEDTLWIERHREVLEAIEAREPERARDLMRGLLGAAMGHVHRATG
jgi:DNA-binding FadR family transcriptional regulator